MGRDQQEALRAAASLAVLDDSDGSGGLKLSAGAACELANVDRYTFLAACREHRIPTAYPPEELEADLAWLSDNGSASLWPLLRLL